MPGRSGESALTSLILPAFNPGAFIDRTWREIRQFLRRASSPWEVLFVCDGCTDGSAERLEELSREEPDRVRVLAYRPNRGKGHAVRRGLEAARGRWRLYTDVDLAYSFDDITRVAAALRGGADVAIASRNHPESRLLLAPSLTCYAYRRHVQSVIFSAAVRTLLPLRQRDTQAGLKGLSAPAARRLLPRLSCNGFGFDCELLTACAVDGLHVVEVPVCVHYRDAASTTGFASMARMLRELWQIRRAWRLKAATMPPPVAEPGYREAA
jgi:dolichyl-phosphate beta-glucosyltransferase